MADCQGGSGKGEQRQYLNWAFKDESRILIAFGNSVDKAILLRLGHICSNPSLGEGGCWIGKHRSVPQDPSTLDDPEQTVSVGQSWGMG